MTQGQLPTHIHMVISGEASVIRRDQRVCSDEWMDVTALAVEGSPLGPGQLCPDEALLNNTPYVCSCLGSIGLLALFIEIQPLIVLELIYFHCCIVYTVWLGPHDALYISICQRSVSQ